jgi:hypothetical protein
MMISSLLSLLEENTMQTEHPSCRIEILSRTEHCSVGYCRRCNIFHVDLGAVSIKLHALQLHALGGSLHQALQVFKQSILGDDTLGGRREAEESVH